MSIQIFGKRFIKLVREIEEENLSIATEASGIASSIKPLGNGMVAGLNFICQSYPDSHQFHQQAALIRTEYEQCCVESCERVLAKG